jgi:cytochrome c-type biogenesis protein CcsB
MQLDRFKNFLLNRLFSPAAFGTYILIFAIAIGVATFVENDFGTSAAQKVIYQTKWFELLLMLFSGALIANIYRFRLISQKKWAILTFHLAMIVIILGAGITRYTGYEGVMHIREGSASNTFTSTEMYLQVEVKANNKRYVFEKPANFASLGNNAFQESYALDGKILTIEGLDFIPNPKEELIFDESGVPILKIVVAGAGGREEYFVRQGEVKRIAGQLFNFSQQDIPGSVMLSMQGDKPMIRVGQPAQIMQMSTRQTFELQPNVNQEILLRSMYTLESGQFVFGDYSPSGRLDIASSARKMTNESMGGLQLRMGFEGQETEMLVFGRKGIVGPVKQAILGNAEVSVSYGAKNIILPFSLALRDFIMERYPGTNSAASYASEVTLVDPEKNIREDRRIFMNNILIHRGYRFFQSSFDQDELGTYLSVNHDLWGTWVSYLGYFLLTLGMILTLFSPNSRFTQLSKKLKKMQGKTAVPALLLLGFFTFSIPNTARGQNSTVSPIPASHGELFSRVVIQDFRGRMKPLHTFTNEVLRKLSREETWNGWSSDQVVLGMSTNPSEWYSVPLIKPGKHEFFEQMFPGGKKLLAYKDFFNLDGSYKLRDQVREAYNKPQQDRGVLEKELIKVDERVNICNMIFSGTYFKAFPVPGDPNNTWVSSLEAQRRTSNPELTAYASSFFPAYVNAVKTAQQSGQWQAADQMLMELQNFQRQEGAAVIPNTTKIKAEIWLNDLHVFDRLGSIYGLLGVIFLGFVFYGVFALHRKSDKAELLFYGLLWLAFGFHTLGLGLRWYVSGRAPWSNGYESMIYIAWTTTLAGILFSRRSAGVLAATNVLAATILMVAGLSWLDPEITPLVPVLKSYWLTIHVSLEAGSYGFLMLGAIVGLLNLILMILATPQNGEKIYQKVKEMTWISEMTLIGGLFMISIGTYLGGVWANESWGRYWGWDAKETWALVTILVYAFILHMRFIPGLKSLYAFNVASLFGWASVIMTYFGVNYYLSGLHSYAAGDPVPIPPFVYYSVAILTVISLLAFWRFRAFKKGTQINLSNL